MIRSVYAALLAAGLAAFAVPASATQLAPGAATIALAAKQKGTKPPTPAQLAFRARQKKCGDEWRAAKAAGKTNGMKWPQFWSACNKRLKGGG